MDMDLPIRFNKVRKTAKILFAQGDDFGFLQVWEDQLGDNPLPKRKDSVEFARLAHLRYTTHSPFQPYASAVKDFAAYIEDNPHREVGCLVLFKCDWFPECDVIGLCHFRRTWSNRIVLDYLCAHPSISEPVEQYPYEVEGVGSSLLYFVVQIAKACGSDLIWGETTQNSWKFYKRAFKLDEVKDLLYVPEKQFLDFGSKLESLWARQVSEPNPELEEIYRVEKESSPFVGSKTPMFGPPRTLVQHFMDLSLDLKQQVATALGFDVNVVKIKSDAELFRVIFSHAASKGKLSDFWTEVEQRHGDGQPSPNPFRD